jgi:hypothetical protein
VTIALPLIAKFGQTATYTQTVEGTYSPTTATFSTGTTSTATVSAVVFPYDAREVDGTNVQALDRKVFIAPDAMTITPKIGDTITLADGTITRVLNIGRIYKGSTSELLILQARSVPNG